MYRLTQKEINNLKDITVDFVNFEDFEKVISIKEVDFSLNEYNYSYNNNECELYLLCDYEIIESYKLLIIGKIEIGIHNIDCLISYKVNKPLNHQKN